MSHVDEKAPNTSAISGKQLRFELAPKWDASIASDNHSAGPVLAFLKENIGGFCFIVTCLYPGVCANKFSLLLISVYIALSLTPLCTLRNLTSVFTGYPGLVGLQWNITSVAWSNYNHLYRRALGLIKILNK